MAAAVVVDHEPCGRVGAPDVLQVRAREHPQRPQHPRVDPLLRLTRVGGGVRAKVQARVEPGLGLGGSWEGCAWYLVLGGLDVEEERGARRVVGLVRFDTEAQHDL